MKRLNLDEAQEAEQVSDEENCLSRIMQRQVRVDGMTGPINRSIGELIQIGTSGKDSVAITASMARDVLPRYGIAVESGKVYFSNTHNEIEHSLMNTAWQSGWSRILLRLDGASKGDKTYRFAGSSTRFVILPFDVFE